MRYSKHVFVTVLTALAVGLSVLPAAADITDIGTISGTAEVGKTFWSEDDCDKTGRGTVVGEGLYVAGSTQDLARGRQGAWHLRTTIFGFALGPVELEVCGWLGPHDGTITDKEDRTSGLGPACGASKGHHGMGEIRTQFGEPILKLIDVGWKENVGDVLALTGKYQQYNPDGTKKNKFGTVAAQLLVAGGAACLFEPGAQRFDMFGTFELVNTGDTKPPKQPDKEELPMTNKECKETDPNTDKEKDQDPGSDADFKRDECPSARK